VLLPLLLPETLQANRTASSGLFRSRTISSGFCHCFFPISLTFLETLMVEICTGKAELQASVRYGASNAQASSQKGRPTGFPVPATSIHF